MNEEKKVPFKWEYGEETISLQLGMYANNQRLYIGMITHTEDGAEAFADMTVNLPGYSLDPGEAFISGDISKDLLRFIWLYDPCFRTGVRTGSSGTGRGFYQ